VLTGRVPTMRALSVTFATIDGNGVVVDRHVNKKAVCTTEFSRCSQ